MLTANGKPTERNIGTHALAVQSSISLHIAVAPRPVRIKQYALFAELLMAISMQTTIPAQLTKQIKKKLPAMKRDTQATLTALTVM